MSPQSGDRRGLLDLLVSFWSIRSKLKVVNPDCDEAAGRFITAPVLCNYWQSLKLRLIRTDSPQCGGGTRSLQGWLSEWAYDGVRVGNNFSDLHHLFFFFLHLMKTIYLFLTCSFWWNLLKPNRRKWRRRNVFVPQSWSEIRLKQLVMCHKDLRGGGGESDCSVLKQLQHQTEGDDRTAGLIQTLDSTG